MTPPNETNTSGDGPELKETPCSTARFEEEFIVISCGQHTGTFKVSNERTEDLPEYDYFEALDSMMDDL
jgi:hypothetical protein